jgi:RHS repeat-associated protein
MTALIALATFGSLVIVAQPAAATAVATHAKLSPPPNYVHHTRIVGHIVRPQVCEPGPPTLPAPSANSLAYLAESTTNEVQVVDESTGALVGTPITVGTDPKGVAYWTPPASSTRDPLVIVTNSGSHSVTIIDAVTQTVVATISLPSGSGGVSVAADPTQPYAVVVDHESGKVSIIDLTSYTDAGQITLTSTANALADVAFDSSGSYAYITDPVDNKIFSIAYTGGSAPWFILEGNYHNASYDFTGIGSDLSGTSDYIYATDAQASSGHLLQFTPGSVLSSPTVVRSWASDVPGGVAVAPGGTYVYVNLTNTNQVSVVDIPASTATLITPNSGFANLRAIALSADGATLLSANTASDAMEANNATSGDALYDVTADAEVWAIATPPPSQDAWDVYVSQPTGGVFVVNSGTGAIVQQIGILGAGAEATSPDGKYVYVADYSGSDVPQIQVIETALVSTTTNPVVATITGIQGSEPNTPDLTSLAVSPSGDSLLATDSANGAVYVIDTNSADGSSYRTVVNRVGLLGGSDSTVVTPTGGLTFSADGLHAYATEQGVSSNSYDGVTVLSKASLTTTGYSYDATDEALTQDGPTMITPAGIAVNPNGEDAYVTGTDSSLGGTWALFTFPLGTNGQLEDGGPAAPVSTGTQGYGVVYSPEDDSAFVSNVGSEAVSSVSQQDNDVAWDSAVDGLGGNIAVSPDGLYVATTLRVNTCGGVDGMQLLDAGTGDVLSGASIPGDEAPVDVVIAPQASPQSVSTSELAGGATNPAESAVTSGMNDVVSSGTPSDAPGASAGVDTATGAYSMSVDSMTIPDIGPSLDETASYDSSRASDNDLLGYGWDYSYGITASQNGTSCVITVTWDDGATSVFNPDTTSGACSSRNYEAPGWAQDALTTASDCNGSDSCWVINLDASLKYDVDETTGQLVKEVDLNGNTVTVSWGSHTACSGATSTEPCQVTAADGIRTLTFSYPAAGSGTCPSGTFTCVVVTDPLGRTLTYVKDSAGDLIQIALSNTAVSGSTDQTATYALAYGSGHVLDSWWDPQNNAADAGNTAFATDVAYTSGKVTQVTGPEIYSATPLSTTPITPTTTFTYEDVDTATGTGTVLIDNPDFNQSNYEPGASQTLDTYADFQLVSSVTGYGALGAYDDGSTPPVVPINPSESATPMRDDYNEMPSESMNALAGSTVPAIGTQDAQYDNGIVLTTYDANGNALLTMDESGDATSTTYNALNEPLVSTDPMGNTTTSTYNATGQLLGTSSPPNFPGNPDTTVSNWYNANGTVCASRDAIETSAYGVLSSCVASGSHATTYSYDASGDQTLATVTDTTTPSTATSTTQEVYDANGDVCATLDPNGYALGALSSTCPTSGAGYATVNLALNDYDQPTETITSLTVGGTNTYATNHNCTNANGEDTASVGPLGAFTSCSSLSHVASTDTSFNSYDANGDPIQSASPISLSGSPGPTVTQQFDADGSVTTSLSAQGYAAWTADESADLVPFESVSLQNDLGNQVSTAPLGDDAAACVDNASLPCPDTTVDTYDSDSQLIAESSSGNGQAGMTPIESTATNNPDEESAGGESQAGTGSAETTETSLNTYSADQQISNALNEHWTGSSWVIDSAMSAAYAPDGSTCWTTQTDVSAPTCASPPTTGGSTTASYYDADGDVVAEVGPGGAGVVEPGGSCDPTAALTVYGINLSKICAYTTYSVYDEGGQEVEAIEPSPSDSTSGYVAAGLTWTYGYDLDGNQTTETTPSGNTITTTYDAADRPDGISYSDSAATIQYRYNADGARSQMIDSSGTTTYSYNIAGRLESVTDGNGNTVTYGYNSFGQVDCVSYPGFSNDCTTAGAGTDSPPTGDVTYNYDGQGRLSSVIDWVGDAFSYAYDCTGNVAWMAETPSSQLPTIVPCQGSSGSVPTAPTPPSGSTYLVTSFAYSTGATGGDLQSITTSADTSSSSSPLLGFGSSSLPLAYSDSGDLTGSTPYIDGTAQAEDNYSYDFEQRVISGPETSGSVDSYSYASSSGSQPFYSNPTTDGMAIDASPLPGSSAQLGSEYAANGELCWIAENPSVPTGSCASPSESASDYETFSYDASGNRTGSVANGFGTDTDLMWDDDTGTLTCQNTNGTTCATPSAVTPDVTTFIYDGDGLRMDSTAWDPSSSSTVTTPYTWNTLDQALISNGSFDFIYGLSPNVPIAQIDTNDSVTSELLADSNFNIRGVVEVSTAADSPDTLINYTDYDAFGNPITKSGGAANSGGLLNPVSTDPDTATSFGFEGGYTDASGMDCFVHRYYDPASGQFISVDPDLGSTQTPYSYASDDPINETDPLGLGNPFSDVLEVGEEVFNAEVDVDADIVQAAEDIVGAVAVGTIDLGEGLAAGAVASLIPECLAGLALGVAIAAAWEAATPTQAGGHYDAPILFTQRRIGPTFSDGRTIGPSNKLNNNTVPIDALPWIYDGRAVFVALSNRRLANYSLRGVRYPPVRIPAVESLKKLNLYRRQWAREVGIPPAAPKKMGVVPGFTTAITVSKSDDALVTSVPGAPHGFVTSRCYVHLDP